MMVMREDTHHGIYAVVGVSVSASFFHSSSQQQLLPAGLSTVGMTGRENELSFYSNSYTS